MKVGFIGLGTMGASMASNLQAGGPRARGARRAEGRGRAAPGRGRDLEGHPAGRSRRAWRWSSPRCPGRRRSSRSRSGADGLIHGMQKGTAYFDLSTNSPALMRRLHALFTARGIHVLDAPVSGGPEGAKSGKLALWVGGDREVFDRFKPVLDAIGDQPYYVGPDRRGLGRQARAQLRGLRDPDRAGRGVHAWGSRRAWTPLTLWKAVRQGAGGRRRTFDGLPTSSCPGTFDPPAFALRLRHKDVSLAVALGRELGVPMRMANLALEEMTEAHEPRLGRARLAGGHAAAGGAGGREDRGAARAAGADPGAGRAVRRPARALLVGLALLAWPAGALAQGEPSPALRAYVQGLNAIRQGRYAEAVTALGQAMQAAPDPAFILARGIAQCLAEQPGAAIADLELAKRSGLKGREADLWTYTAQMMSNGQQRSSLDNKGPGGRGWFGGAPGHIIQGRDDYPTDYASFVYYEMATPYAKGVTPAVREAMRQAGAWFANRAATRADLVPAHLARARELYAQGAWAAVLDEVAFVRPVQPASGEVHIYSGGAWLELGRAATARRELTIGLTAQTSVAYAYLGRALAAARLGDAARARSDLDTAARYDAGLAGRRRAAIEQEIAAGRADGQPDALLAALEASVRAGAAQEALVGQALTLHRAMAGRRLRYDEWYQDHVRELGDAVRAAPKSAAPYAELARFVIEEANLAYRGEDVEPRHGPQRFRWQSSQAAELRAAVGLCDAALAAQPDHIGAQTVKAIALVRLGDEVSAEQIVNRVLAAAPRNPEALRLRARFLVERASALYARAAALRAPRIESSSYTETRSDGVYRVTETRYYPPTGEAIAQAAQLEAQAAELMRASRAALDAALAVLRNTFEGDMLQAEVESAAGRSDAAFAALGSALRRQPRSLEANQTLAELYRRLGRVDESDRQMSVTTNLVHTNAGWLLRMAWRKTMGHDPTGARAALDEARRLDPDRRAGARLPGLAAGPAGAGAGGGGRLSGGARARAGAAPPGRGPGRDRAAARGGGARHAHEDAQRARRHAARARAAGRARVLPAQHDARPADHPRRAGRPDVRRDAAGSERARDPGARAAQRGPAHGRGLQRRRPGLQGARENPGGGAAVPGRHRSHPQARRARGRQRPPGRHQLRGRCGRGRGRRGLHRGRAGRAGPRRLPGCPRRPCGGPPRRASLPTSARRRTGSSSRSPSASRAGGRVPVAPRPAVFWCCTALVFRVSRGIKGSRANFYIRMPSTAGPTRLPIRARITLAAALALAVLVAIPLVTYRSVGTLVETSTRVGHTHEVLGTLESLLGGVITAETGVRGYVLTGEERFLGTYWSGMQR